MSNIGKQILAPAKMSSNSFHILSNIHNIISHYGTGTCIKSILDFKRNKKEPWLLSTNHDSSNPSDYSAISKAIVSSDSAIACNVIVRSLSRSQPSCAAPRSITSLEHPAANPCIYRRRSGSFFRFSDSSLLTGRADALAKSPEELYHKFYIF